MQESEKKGNSTIKVRKLASLQSVEIKSSLFDANKIKRKNDKFLNRPQKLSPE